ncbi:MAG: hypothetical protein ACLFQ8_03330 [Candidatus Aenigmatarchaeota archaeon]
MVLGKIKDMLTPERKGQGSDKPRSISKVSRIDEETEENKSPINTRRRRENLDMPSTEDLPDVENSPRRGNRRSSTSRENQRRRPSNTTRERDFQRPENNLPRRDKTNNRRMNEPASEEKEMLQEILRKLEDIDRKLNRRR